MWDFNPVYSIDSFVRYSIRFSPQMGIYVFVFMYIFLRSLDLSWVQLGPPRVHICFTPKVGFCRFLLSETWTTMHNFKPTVLVDLWSLQVKNIYIFDAILELDFVRKTQFPFRLKIFTPGCCFPLPCLKNLMFWKVYSC